MSTPAADDIANRLLQSWDDVDRWLLAEARELTRLRLVPDTTTYVLHGGVTTLLIRAPDPCAADAEQIGAALAHMVHPLQPDQVLVTLPGTTQVIGGAPIATMRAMAGERGGAWRHLQLPLPYGHPDGEIVLATVETAAPWAAPVQAVFDNAAPPPPDVSEVHHVDAEFTIAVNPNGPAADLAARWPA